MFNNARDIALGTLLLIVAIGCTLIGALGVLLQFIVVGDHPINLLLTTDASLAALLSGLAFLALINQWSRVRILAGGLMVLLATYSVAHSAWEGGADQALSWLTGDVRLDTISAALLALAGVSLAIGAGSVRRRFCLMGVGTIIALAGAIVFVRPIAPDIAFSSAPMAAGLLTLGFGSALILAAMVPWCDPTRLGRMPVLAAVAGVSMSCAVWLLLVGHQQQTLLQRAEFLLDNIQFSAEQTMRSHLLLMRRMAQRVNAAEGGLDQRVLVEDIQNYLADTPSLRSIALLEPGWVWDWQVGREPVDVLWLDEQVRKEAVQSWLAAPYRQPRLLMPQLGRPGMAVLAVGVPNGERHLLASLDLTVLLEQELRLQLGVFQARALWQGQRVLTLSPGDVEPYEAPGNQKVAMRHIGLPGGISLNLKIYPAHPHVWEREIIVPAGVSIGGLTLTWLLSFSLAMVSLAVGRSRQLLAARDQLASQQAIQDMIVHERPLEETLEAACRMLEEQISCSLCSIMLASRDGKRLEFAAGERLPEDYRRATRFIDIGSSVGACGSAAFSRELVICADLASDPRWSAFSDMAAESGLRSCWSYPIVGADHALLGTFCVYRRTVGFPDEHELALSVKAMGLAALAVEKYRNGRSLRTLERSVEASINGVIISDAALPDCPIIYCNRAFSEITGYSREEVLGQNCRFLQGVGTDQQAVAMIRRHLAEQREVHVTLRNYRKDGSPFWNDLYLSPVRDGNGTVTHFVGLQNDISARIAYEEQLTYNASHDLLTGLPNRSMLEDRLKHDFALAKRHGYRIGVLFVDMDDFKPVNDTLGHDLGDRVLMEVADRLKGGLRASDTVARLGGDEFIVVLPDLETEHQALNKAEALLSLLASPYQVPSHELYLTASIGISISDEDTVNPQELIRQADMAMYKAKQKGHNNCQFFTRDITLVLSERIAIRSELQEALAAEELELHYQPLLDGKGALVSVEALLRWRHPQRGYVSPADFIPLAESTGQIVPISEWVFDRACRDMCALTEQGLGEVKVAVNLSPLQFHRASFLSNLRHTLKQTGLPASRLELELTERILMDDAEGAIDVLHALKGMQVDVSIDDFGTGFSSLAYLRALPIDKVKIDRAFVQDVTTNSHDAAIVRGVLSMAHHMGHLVVAEGVETSEQLQYLKELGCDIFQGYLLARPMPLDQLREFIAGLKQG